ncbi:MAG: AbiV family abortive infection protein [Candidatus Thorarchaeota archaeon]
MIDDESLFNAYHNVAEESLDNASDWLELAEYALKSGVSGHAASLALIANEEIAKSFGCYLVAENIVSENEEELKALFSDHYTKTHQMIQFYLSASLSTLASMGFFDSDEFLKNILTANQQDISRAEEEIDKQIQKKVREFLRRRTQGMYVGIRRRKGKIRVRTPKDVGKRKAESTIQTVKDYHELVSVIVKKIHNNPEARKFFKDFLIMLVEESKDSVTFDLKA